MYLKPVHRIGIMAMSVAAPRQLAALMLRVPATLPAGPVQADAEAEPVAFPTKGGAVCRGWWLKPRVGAEDRVVVLAHGWTSQYQRMEMFLEPLLAEGNQVLLYDARGHGGSDPTPYCSVREFSDDLHAAIRFARGRASRIAVIGHSLGASATIITTAEGSGAERLVTIAAFADPVKASADILDAEQLPGEVILQRIMPHVESFIGCRAETVTPELLLRSIQVPVIMIHGTEDEIVPVAHFHRLVAAAGDGVETILIEGGDHNSVKVEPRVLARIRSFFRDW